MVNNLVACEDINKINNFMSYISKVKGVKDSNVIRKIILHSLTFKSNDNMNEIIKDTILDNNSTDKDFEYAYNYINSTTKAMEYDKEKKKKFESKSLEVTEKSLIENIIKYSVPIIIGGIVNYLSKDEDAAETIKSLFS